MESEKHINGLISGASIAGLSAAYWLNKYGFNVTIIERPVHIRPGGRAVDVRGPGLEVAGRMGTLDAICDNSIKLKSMSIVDDVAIIESADLPDFGLSVIPLQLKNY